MSRMYRKSKAIRFAISGAIAASLLAGCAGSTHMARAGSYKAQADGRSASGLNKAEKAVLSKPEDLATRAALAQAYLAAGRFRSAATTFEDVVALGDNSARVQLSLALAHIGAGQGPAAVALLDEARDTIPATDRGLALALAGETGRGIGILSDALRGGENTVKLRQNLAYAYALDGRWREARIMMSQDVPADQIDTRISDWAMMSMPEDVQRRVASLLGVPFGVSDPGQPGQLALGASAPEATSLASAPAAQPAVAAAAELPPVEQAPAPAAQPAPSSGFAQAFLPETAPVAAPSFVSRPVVQPIRVGRVAGFTHPGVPSPASGASPSAQPGAQIPRPAPNGSHAIQLGAFSSEANARRAWNVFTARNPDLRNYRMMISQASVRGRTFWRVGVAGYTQTSAVQACQSVRRRGGACFAFQTAAFGQAAKPVLALNASPPATRRRR